MAPENEEWGDAAERLDESEAEEALSLCDLPTHNNASREFAVPVDHSLSPQQPADIFEFFKCNRLHSDMCPADDIMVSGKLLPLKDQPQQQTDHEGQINGHCRRSESISSHSEARVVRSSRSLLDDRRHRHSSSVPELDRNDCSDKSISASSSKQLVPKSRWQLLISGIGMVKFPPEMELRDIKNRQSRRSDPAALFPGIEAKSPVAASGSTARRGSSWGLIKALSCKDHTSISVTTSFVCMPHN